MQVSFRKIEDTEVVEVELLNGTVAAFLATDKEPESGQRWCDRYGAEYARFKKESEPKPEPKIEEAPVTQAVNEMPEQQHAALGPDFIPPPARDDPKDII